MGLDSDVEKYDAINKTAGLSEKEKWSVIISLKDSSDEMVSKLNSIKNSGVSISEYISYLRNRPKNENGDTTKWSKKKLREWLSKEIKAGRLTGTQADVR